MGIYYQETQQEHLEKCTEDHGAKKLQFLSACNFEMTSLKTLNQDMALKLLKNFFYQNSKFMKFFEQL